MVWIGRDLKDHIIPPPLPWEGTPYTRPGCSKPPPTCLKPKTGVNQNWQIHIFLPCSLYFFLSGFLVTAGEMLVPCWTARLHCREQWWFLQAVAVGFPESRMVSPSPTGFLKQVSFLNPSLRLHDSGSRVPLCFG